MRIELVYLAIGAMASLFSMIVIVPLVEYMIDHLPDPILRFLERIDIIEKSDDVSYQARVRKSLTELEVASKEVDNVVLAISKLAREREATVSNLEGKLTDLMERENELKSKIETLERVPIEAVRLFEEILSKGESRSAWRDYILFALGVIVSTVIAIILKTIG